MTRPFSFRLRTALAVAFVALLAACAAKPVPTPSEPTPEETVIPSRPELMPEVRLDVPQLAGEAAAVSDLPLLQEAEQAALHDLAIERFFAPWHLVRASLTRAQAFWGVDAYGKRQGYAENLQPYPQDRWERLVALQDMGAYPSLGIPAIVTRNTSVRVLPSMRPFFLEPSRPGEGFPFDYFQNSAMWMGQPVFIAHATADHAWYFVETAFVNGWVRSEDVAMADPEFRAQYQTRVMAALLLDDTPLVGNGRFIGQTHIGAIFPLHSSEGDTLTVKVPVRGATGRAEVALAALNSLQAARMPLPLTSRSIAGLVDAMSGQLYGWGGMFENRDCSSTLRDLFLPFGVWLPRNSAQQAKLGGKFISLEGMDEEAKLSAIRTQGVPFGSFLWLPGHIGLYLGVDERAEPLLLHNIWGVRTSLPGGGEGRAILGRLVISTLRLGEDRPDVARGAFLGRIRGLTILGAGFPGTTD